MKFEVKPYGIDAVLIGFGDEINEITHIRVKQIYNGVRKCARNGIRAVIPGYCNITVLFEPSLISFNGVVELSKEILENSKDKKESKYKVKVPVCYDKEYALDWKSVCDFTGLEWEEVIQLHYRNEYLVYMLGFVPGFLYLGGLNEKIKVPRKTSPRLKIPKGAVGLADKQTGIYPIETPGGWQLIGSTPVELIGDGNAIIEMGDYLEFFPITKKEYSLQKKTIERELVNED